MKKTFALNRAFFAAALVLTVLLASRVVFAANDVPATNGNFASDISGWYPYEGCSGGQWADSGHTAPGSALLTITDPDTCAALVQCVPILSLPADYFAISGTIKLNNVSGAATAEIDLYAFPAPDSDCQTYPHSSSASSNRINSGTDWQSASTTQNAQAIAMPASDGSVQIVLYVSGNPGDQAWFDDVTTYTLGSNAVTLHDFAAQPQSSLVWIVPVALLIVLGGAWVALRRRRA